jgi:PST family polysaccharide transporter
MSDKERSYRNTALLGVSSVINILLSIVRNKVFSIFLAPAGIGQFGILNDFINSVHSIGSLGVANSGVQAISKASTQNNGEVKRVFNSLVTFFTFLSLVLVVAVIVFSTPISKAMAGDDSYVWYLRIGAFALLFKFRSTMQSLLITGMKQLGMVAKSNVYQGVITTGVGIVLVIVLRDKAIPFLILSLGVGAWGVTYWQSRKVVVQLPDTQERVPYSEMAPVFLLGVSSLWASLLESVVTLVNKSWINHYFSKDHLGYYQVAVGFTASYIGFITSSIITNYYPNLVTKVQEGISETNEYVNQQIGISMALIMPLLFIMLTFSKLFLLILFSAKFLAANPLLNYTVAGTFIQVIAWPIAFVFLAHRATRIYIISESIGNGSMLLLSFLAMQTGRFEMIGLAYLLHYVIYLALITWLFMNYFSGSISRENVILFAMNAIIIAGIILAKVFLDEWASYSIGGFFILFYLYRSREEYRFMFNTIFKKR